MACWSSQRCSFDIALMWKTAELKLQHDFAKSQESQKNPGLCQKRSGPEAQRRGGDSPLLSSQEIPPGLHPALGPPSKKDDDL